jgi:hypothetical protein
MISTEAKETLQTRLTKFGDRFERCQRPLCDKLMESKSKHAAKKFYCSAKCKVDAWAIKRAAVLLADLHPSAVLEVLTKARDGHG